MAQQVFLSDVLQAKFFCNNAIQNGINVIGYQVTGLTAPGVTDLNCATRLSTLAGPLYQAYLNAASLYAGVKVQLIRPQIYPAQVSFANAGPGLNVSEPLPPSIALLLSPRTGTAGRKGRGRCYLPFWNEDQNAGSGSPTAGAIAAGINFGAIMFAPITVTNGGSVATLTPVIVSRTGILTQIPVTSVLTRIQWATQRRRSLITKPDVLGP